MRPPAACALEAIHGALASTLPGDTGATPRALVAVDLDGDGIKDLVVAYVEGGRTTLVVHRGNAATIYPRPGDRPEAPFADGEMLATVATTVRELLALDVDRDGAVDIVARDDGGDAYLLRANGDGTVRAAKAIGTGSAEADVVHAADEDARARASERAARRARATGADAASEVARTPSAVRAADGAIAEFGARAAIPAEASASVEIEPPADALAVERMRLNDDGVPDLVVIRQGAAAPELFVSRAAAVFNVTSTADTGGATCGAQCTLRQAINAANATVDADAIHFAIPQSDPGFDAVTGTYRIRPASELPAITKPVTLDATTQDGFAGRPIVEIDGSLAPAPSIGLVLMTTDSVVRGFVINRFPSESGGGTTTCGCGIALDSPFTGNPNNLIIEGNYLGVDVTGTVSRENGQSGVFIVNGESDVIGGTTPAARNVISGHPFAGIAIEKSENTHVIAGNFIGTDRSGTLAIPNRIGVLTNSSSSVIGGTDAGARNLISGNIGDGVQISAFDIFGIAQNNQVIGNFIGTTVDGTFPLPNNSILGGAGVHVADASGNVVGKPGAGNVIAGNTHAGVAVEVIRNRSKGANKVQGNRIGVDPLGRPLGNGGYGIFMSNQFGDDIGGRNAGEGNIIAFNGDDGIELRAIVVTCPNCTEFNMCLRNRFFSNLIYANGGIGIDLRNDGLGNPMTNPDGVTPNDPGNFFVDDDFGANGLKNFPVLTSATSTDTTSHVTGTRNFGQVQFFMSSSCDPSGNGEGQILLGEIPTGQANIGEPFDLMFPMPIPAGYVVTAIETEADQDGSSEFSTCLAATGGPAPVLTATPTPGPTVTLVGGTPVGGKRTSTPNGGATGTPTHTTTPTRTATTTPHATVTPAPERCDDCLDNDFDGKIDRADSDCPPPANGSGMGIGGDAKAGKALIACEKQLAKGGTTVALKRLRALGKCLDKAFACVQQKSGDASCLGKAGAACAKAETARITAATKLQSGVTKRCGDPAVAATDLAAAIGLGFGAEEPGCSDFGEPTLDDAAAVASCLAARHACRAEALLGTAYPRARELMTEAGRDPAVDAPCLPPGGAGGSRADGKAIVKCQKGLAKAGAAYAKTRLQAHQKCAAAVLACVQLKASDAGCLSKAGAGCTKLDAKVAAAVAKLEASIAKACGGSLPSSDLIDGDGVGFGLRAGECIALGAAAPNSASTVATCLAAQHACRIDQLVEGQTPRAAELRALAP